MWQALWSFDGTGKLCSLSNPTWAAETLCHGSHQIHVGDTLEAKRESGPESQKSKQVQGQ